MTVQHQISLPSRTLPLRGIKFLITRAPSTIFGSKLKIFKLPGRVLAIRDDDGVGEHLEHVFGNMDYNNMRGSLIKPDRVYGTLPKLPKAEKSE